MKKKYLFLWLFPCFWGIFSLAFAQQKDSLLELKEVLITGIRESSGKETSLNINALSKEKLTETGAANLSGALATLPGISQLTTGVGISKPVIRGLYGNRVLVLLSSLKFDNQQWQDEHGLGLSDVGISKVEVIKGPASILYGSEAVGGVVNIIEEKPKADGKLKGDWNTKFFSNTLGFASDVGISKNTGKKWWRVRLGTDNQADYSDGKNNRVLNSRFNGYYAKASFGFQKKNWVSTNNYNCSYNRFGFIMEDTYQFLTPDNRWSRKLAGPHHAVLLNVFSSQNILQLKKSTLKWNVGIQSNVRMEDEGGGSISLNMHLFSIPYNVQWRYPINTNNELIISGFGALENNTNYGGRIIVPDANMAEQGLSIFYKKVHSLWTFESGLGINDKFIQTFATRSLNTPDKEMQPFKQNRLAFNGLGGIVFNPSEKWNIKLNGSTGYRTPNLAELSSNGLHEGIFRFEIGKPNLKNEQNINAETSLNFQDEFLSASLAVFRNQFFNYLYLAPTNEDYFGFPVFRYQQNHAHLYGGELSLAYTFPFLKGLSWVNSLSNVTGKLENGGYLPYIPATKWNSNLRYNLNLGKKISESYFYVASDYVLAQNNPATNETATPAYFLLHAGLGTKIQFRGQTLVCKIMGTNLLNKQYFDHLSRFKNYGIYNMGRNIVFSLQIPIMY